MSEQEKKREQVFGSCCGSEMRDHALRENAPGACPMSGMCAGLAGRMPIGWFLAGLGIVLIGLGVLALVEPRVLVWLIAGAVIVAGVAALVGAVVARRLRVGHARS